MSISTTGFNSTFTQIRSQTLALSPVEQQNLAAFIGELSQAVGLLSLFSEAFVGVEAHSLGSGSPALEAGFLPPPQMQSISSGYGTAQAPAMALGSQEWGLGLLAAIGSFHLESDKLSMGGTLALFGDWSVAQDAVTGLRQETSEQLALGVQSQVTTQRVAGFAGQAIRVETGEPASFPPSPGSDFLTTLIKSSANASRLNVSGSRDVTRINQAIEMLKEDAVKVSTAAPDQKPGTGQLKLSAEQVEAIRQAPDLQAAKEIVAQAIAAQTGTKCSAPDMQNKSAIRGTDARNAVNALLGTKVRAGREKNSGSSLVLDSMLESVARSVRGGSFGMTTVSQDYAVGVLGQQTVQARGLFATSEAAIAAGISSQVTSAGMIATGSSSMVVENASQALMIDLDDYTDSADKVGELASPLIFDLEGLGLKIKNGGMIEIDLDGDGTKEVITELDPHIGLLVFDSRYDGDAYAAGRDMFGNGTDLSAYGIEAGEEKGTFDNGFDALRALAEHYKLVADSKQHLDAEDLRFLEREVGLRMRVGGVVAGRDRRFAKLGIARIDLGSSEKTFTIEESPSDAYGNKLMLQQGAVFTVDGEERPYADLWFNIQARVVEEDLTPLRGLSTAALLASNRRI